MLFKKKIFLVSLIFSFLIISNIIFALGIGASPARIHFSNMLRGGYAEATLVISNPGDQEIMVRVGAEGEISNWISFDPSEPFPISGKSAKTVVIMVEPPSDQPNGIYNGTVIAVSSPPPGEIGGLAGAVAVSAVGITLQAQINDIEIKDYIVERVSVVKAEECKPIQVIVWIRNTGNVRITPTFHIDISDKEETKILKSFDHIGKEILPTRTEYISIKIPPDLPQIECIPVGVYKLRLIAYLNSEVKHDQKYYLEIVPRGTLSIKGELLELNVKGNATMGELLKVTGKFKNTGEVPVEAKLKIEDYLGGTLLGVSESETLEILFGETSDLTVYFTPWMFGRHNLRGTVLFSGKVSNEKEAFVDVAASLLFIIGIVIVIIIIIAVIYFIRKRKPELFKKLKRKRVKK
ncbi:MAG: hypothetical protein ACE5J4_00865 [Candidatus Aenigmatarchaeota archaeon]